MNDFELTKDLELEPVRPETRKNADRLNQLISDDFEDFGCSGKVFDNNCILKLLPKSKSAVYHLDKFRFKPLSDGCILVKYISQVEGNRAHRSSIWTKAGKR